MHIYSHEELVIQREIDQAKIKSLSMQLKQEKLRMHQMELTHKSEQDLIESLVMQRNDLHALVMKYQAEHGIDTGNYFQPK